MNRQTLGLLATLRIGKAILQLIKDPTKTEKIFDIAEIGLKAADQEALRPIVDKALADAGFRALYERRYLPPLPDIDALAKLPDGTLGRAYADHMLGNGLKPDFYPDVEAISVGYYLEKRARQTHDIWHVVTGYDTSVYGELCLQGFSWANVEGGLSAIIVGAGIFHVLQNAPTESIRYMDGIVEGYQLGRKARYFLGIPWEEQWERPLADLRREAGIA